MYIQRIQDPHGALYDQFAEFARGHPQASFFQSPEFFGELRACPATEPILLLAVHGQKLRDPGLRYHKDVAAAQPKPTGGGDPLVAASMLAVVINDHPPLRRWLSSYTLAYGGPLVGDGTRLEKEQRIRMLLEALGQQVRRKSAFTQLHVAGDAWEMLPLYKELGYDRTDRVQAVYGNRGTPWMQREYADRFPEGADDPAVFSRVTGKMRFLFR